MKRREREFKKESRDQKKRRLNKDEYHDTPPAEDITLGKKIWEENEKIEQNKAIEENLKISKLRMIDDDEELEEEEKKEYCHYSVMMKKGDFDIHIYTLDRKLTLRVSSEDSIEVLRKKIFYSLFLGTSNNQSEIELIFNGKSVFGGEEEGRTIGDYNLKNNSVLDLMILQATKR